MNHLCLTVVPPRKRPSARSSRAALAGLAAAGALLFGAVPAGAGGGDAVGVARTQAAAATRARVEAEGRLARATAARTRLEQRATALDGSDAASASELATARQQVRQLAVAAFIDGGRTELLQAAVENSARQYLKVAQLLPTAVKAVGAAGKAIASTRTPKGERSLNLGLAPKTIFNESITNQRSYITWSVPLDELKTLGKRVGGTVNTIVMALCASALRRFLKERGELPKQALIAAVPVSLRTAGDDSMNNQVSMVRVDLATDIDDVAERFKAIHASSEAAKAVVRELRPVLGVDMPVTGAPWIMTSLASLYGRSKLARQLPPAGNVAISNVPGPATPLYMAGARMVNYFPVSIPGHGMALNITVHSYAGQLEFGLTACRRVLPQQELQELVDDLKTALEEIKALPSVAEAGAVAPTPAAPRKRVARAATNGSVPAKPARPARKTARAAKTAAKAASPPARSAAGKRA